MDYKEKLKEVSKLVAESQKKGDGRLGFAADIPDVSYISSGIEALDRLTGSYGAGKNPEYLRVGGIPFGRYTIFWGPEGVGKSTLIDRIIAKAQAQDKVCMLIDGENRRTKPWMAAQGIDLDTLIWHRGGIMENALQDLINLLPLVDLMAVDTVHSLVPKAETEDNKGKERNIKDDAPMGRQAFALGKFFRVATHRVAKAQAAVVLVGQARDVVNVTVPLKMLVGGNALMHYATLRMQITKITDKNIVPRKKVRTPDGAVAEVPVGFMQKIKLEKAGTNHMEGQTILVPFLYGLGPDDFVSNIMAAVGAGIIANPTAGRYEVPTSEEPVKIHGKDALLQFFVENCGHYEWMMDQITRPATPGETGVQNERKEEEDAAEES